MQSITVKMGLLLCLAIASCTAPPSSSEPSTPTAESSTPSTESAPTDGKPAIAGPFNPNLLSDPCESWEYHGEATCEEL